MASSGPAPGQPGYTCPPVHPQAPEQAQTAHRGSGGTAPPVVHSTSPKGTRVKVTRWAETHCHHADDLGAEVDGRGDSGRDGDSGGVWWEQKR